MENTVEISKIQIITLKIGLVKVDLILRALERL